MGSNLRLNVSRSLNVRLEAEIPVLSGERRGEHKLTALRMRRSDKHLSEKFMRNMRIMRSKNTRATFAKRHAKVMTKQIKVVQNREIKRASTGEIAVCGKLKTVRNKILSCD